MRLIAVGITIVMVMACSSSSESPDDKPKRRPDIRFVPTPEPLLAKMLSMAKVGASDIVYDLGSGDGRIVIAAARDFGARGVGIDLDPKLVRIAKENAVKAGVADRVEFRVGDIFEEDLSQATVVTLYLLPRINLKLKPKLFRELKPGSRIVSQSFDFGDWKPEQTEIVDGNRAFLWTIPENARELADAPGGAGSRIVPGDGGPTSGPSDARRALRPPATPTP
ncbi:MAG: cyclopropane-fatty-acyl-phospholipid synthase family protein [Kofleriaceae bacterium]